MYLRDLLLNWNNIDSFEIAERNIEKSNFPIWTGLRDSIPFHLKDNTTSISHHWQLWRGLLCEHKESRDYHLLLISKEPNYLMQSPFFIGISTYQKSNYNKPFCSHIKLLLNLTSELFSIKYFRILYTNQKLYKIDFFSHKDCTFIKANQQL